MSQKRTGAGFTIIELLIATAIFSVILLIITTAVLQFSKQYYKGVIASSTQGTARALIDDVARSIQFNGGGVSEFANGYCIGTSKRYSYALNRQVIDNGPIAAQGQSRHGLVSDTITGCNTATGALPNMQNLATLPAGTNARELLGQRMRLAKFDIDGTNNNYTITVRVVYGDNDLLSNPTDPNMFCKPEAGSQFCAVSELSTTVRKRVQ